MCNLLNSDKFTSTTEIVEGKRIVHPSQNKKRSSHLSFMGVRLQLSGGKNANKICDMITSEHGKVFNDAMGELVRAIENVEFACGAPELLKSEHSKNVKLSLK